MATERGLSYIWFQSRNFKQLFLQKIELWILLAAKICCIWEYRYIHIQTFHYARYDKHDPTRAVVFFFYCQNLCKIKSGVNIEKEDNDNECFKCFTQCHDFTKRRSWYGQILKLDSSKSSMTSCDIWHDAGSPGDDKGDDRPVSFGAAHVHLST